MVKRGIIQTGAGFRETYDETLKPQISLEYPVVLRWLHTLQDGDLRFVNSLYFTQYILGEIRQEGKNDHFSNITYFCRISILPRKKILQMLSTAGFFFIKFPTYCGSALKRLSDPYKNAK